MEKQVKISNHEIEAVRTILQSIGQDTQRE